MNYITSTQVWKNLKARTPDTHKGSYGSVICVAGSSEYRGAAALCALGALRGGAGLVTLASSEAVIDSIAGQILEATFISMPSPAVFKQAEKASCIAIGCGMTKSAETLSICTQLLPLSNRAVIDAGALMSMCDNLNILKTSKNVPIITPHPGEMAVLIHKSTEEIQANREQTAREFAKQHGCIVVLKGSHTLVAEPSGEVWQNSTGNAGLSRGGSGDILTGIIAAFCALGLTPLNAAICAVYLHGHAADLCAARLSMQGMLPHDILLDLCEIFKENGR